MTLFMHACHGKDHPLCNIYRKYIIIPIFVKLRLGIANLFSLP